MRTLPAPLLAQLRTSETDEPWLILFEIAISGTDYYRLVKYTQPVTWAGKTFNPFPVDLGEFKTDADGTLPSVQITVSNITREVEQAMDDNDGLADKTVTIYIVHKDFLDDPRMAAVYRAKIGSSSYDSRAAVFSLVFPGLMNAPHPPSRYSRNRCRWVYKSAECGYLGTLATCNKTLTDCVIHGDDDDTAGRAVLHPLRFGGQPGIARFT